MSDPYLQLRTRFAVSAALLLAACGGGSSNGTSSSSGASAVIASRPVDQTDLDIAATIYSGQTRTPAGFYAESAPSVQGTVATLHLKNTDIDPLLAHSQARFELCTNDWNEALAWSEASAQNAQEYSALVATNDEARYFEFGRVKSGTPQVYVQSRIYKCAYLDRAGSDLRIAGGAAGKMNIRPLSADELKRLSEYLWQFTDYNNFGHAVLKSTGASSPAPEHTLHIASLARGGMSATCDRIDVIAWKHSVDPTSGALTLTVQQQFSFGARESAGVAQLCAT